MKYSSKIYRRFRFSHEFFRYLLIDRILNRKDNVVLITGKRGSGKTTLAIKQIMGFSNMEMNEEYYNIQKNIMLEKSDKIEYELKKFTPFSMEEHMCFSRKELQTLWKEQNMAFILADEAVVNASRRNSMTKANKILMEIVTINRKNFNTVFFCMPSIEDFDLAILQYITHWIHIDDRGLGAVMLPNAPSLFGRKSWDIDKMKKIYEKFLEDNPSAASVPYWLFSNFRGYIRFNPLSEKVEAKYEEIAHDKKNRESNGDEEKEKTENQIEKENKNKLYEEVAKKLMNGDIDDTQDYYKQSVGLGVSKTSYNDGVNKALFKLGDGRTFSKVIKEKKQENQYEKEKSGFARGFGF